MLLLLLHHLIIAIFLMRCLHWHTVDVLVLGRSLLLWIERLSRFVGFWRHHELLLVLHLLIVAVLDELLRELLLVLLGDQLAQLLIAKQNLV